MSFLQDKQIRRYVIFLAIFALVTLCAGGLFVIDQSDAVRTAILHMMKPLLLRFWNKVFQKT